ncbi:MAG: CPBP family intramembrane glutamic endopeptidase [Spirochaetota bacterium]
MQSKTAKTVIILGCITVLYTLYRYQGSAEYFINHLRSAYITEDVQAFSVYYQWISALLLLGIVPVFIVRLGFKERPKDYGLGFFSSRPIVQVFITMLGIAIVTPVTFFGARNPDLASLYPLVQNAGSSWVNWLKSSGIYFLYYVGYEFAFRGFLLMGTKDDIGAWQAGAVSLAATVLLHVNRPQPETIMAVVAGMIFPFIVIKLKSLWPVILIHAYAGISLDYWIIMNRGGF